ncbi:TonB-dependent siderophore receptor [Chitinivorax sp. B]|uniref:TonB-dependent siderophore receptor n=1 Tax=Chitinivorax sp. B TaxID=2502235 RepID=UPI0010F9BDEB|nr:TonB-dependent siderophore receptor [Chitinivorax sp. B]
MFNLKPGVQAVSMALATLVTLTSLAQADETVLPTVSVNAQTSGNTPIDQYRAKRAGNGALGTRDLLETPFSINVVTQAMIENRQATQISDVFKADAGVTPLSDNVISESSGIAIRGLQLSLLDGFKIDGLAIPNWGADLPLEHFERIDLLKGASGFLHGFGTPGGIANFVLKRPTNQPYASVEMGYASKGVFKVQGDLGGRIDNGRLGYRLNAVHEGGDTFVDDGNIKRDSASLALDVQLAPNVRWSVDALYQKRRVDAAYYGVVLAHNWGMSPTPVQVPSPFDGSKRLAQDFTYYETKFKVAGTELLWALNTDWNVRLSYRHSTQDRLNADSGIVVLDNAGNYAEQQYATLSRYRYQHAQAMVNGRANTGELQHELNMGVSWQQLPQQYPGVFGEATLGVGNLHNIVRFPDPHQSIDQNLHKTREYSQKAVFASDTIRFNEQWSTIAGLRYTKYSQQTYDGQGNEQTRYRKNPVTPTLAVIYKPAADLALYGSYIESLEAGGTAPQTAINRDEVFEPLKSRQYELGGKLTRAQWSANAALFRVERGLEYQRNDGYYVQQGRVNYQGLELEGKTQLGDWTLAGGAMWLNAKHAEAGADVQGKRAEGTPHFQAKLYTEYALPQVRGLALTGGAQYVGSRPLEANNTTQIDSFRTFDLGARYTTRYDNHKVIFRLNVDNVTNEKYWMPSWGSLLVSGAPRTVKASAQVVF